MKKLFKSLALGLALTAATVAPTFAQQDECDKLYNTDILPNRNGPELAKIKIAIDASKQFLEKCATVEAWKDPAGFVQKNLPNWEKKYNFGIAAERFNKATIDAKTVNADEAFSAGKTLVQLDPNLTTSVAIVLASIGFDQSAAATPVDKYNNDAVNFAKQAIQRIEGGENLKQWGANAYTFKSKEETLSWLNYYVGSIMYNRQNQKKEALSHLYKSTQYGVGAKSSAAVYQMIGDFYKTEFNRIDDERLKIVEEAKPLANDDPKKKELADKASEMLALQKGYAERMLDAYARARNNAPATDQAYKDGLYNAMKVLYEVRFDKKDGLDAYLSSISSKPMPDPTSAVTPIVETPTATTTSTTAPTTTVPTVTAPATTKQANGTTTATTAKTASTTATTNGTTAKPATNGTTNKTNGTTGKTTPAKKPAPKKKGTR
jgi:hypothetical protein